MAARPTRSRRPPTCAARGRSPTTIRSASRSRSAARSTTPQLGAQGGAFTINHDGKPYTFDLDCSRPDVVCPGEAWPNQVVIEQRDVQLQHQMVVDLPTASCNGALTQPDPGSCGTGTNNPNCDLVCGGDITVADQRSVRRDRRDGDSFRLYLGGGVVTNGINCAMLGYSVADATLDSTGQGARELGRDRDERRPRHDRLQRRVLVRRHRSTARTKRCSSAPSSSSRPASPAPRNEPRLRAV